MRARFWGGAACDGTEETPYERDEASKAAAQRMPLEHLAVASNAPAAGPAAPVAPEVSRIEEAAGPPARGQKRAQQAPGEEAGAEPRRSARIRARAERANLK